MDLYSLKDLVITDCLAKTPTGYRKLSFLVYAFKESKTSFCSVVDPDVLQEFRHFVMCEEFDREQNITEMVFKGSKDFEGLVLSSNTRVKEAKDYSSFEVETKVILGVNPELNLSSDDLFDMYRTICIISKIGDPKAGTNISCAIKGRKRGICLDESLLVLKFKSEVYRKEENVKGKVI